MWDELDEKLGFPKYQEGPPKTGWLVNMVQVLSCPYHPPPRLELNALPPLQTLTTDEQNPQGQAGVDYYFIQDDGMMFKSTISYEPYFYLACRVSSASSCGDGEKLTIDLTETERNRGQRRRVDYEEVRGSGGARGEDQEGGSEAGSSRLTPFLPSR